MSKMDFEADSKKFASKISRKPVFADENPNYHRNKLFGGLFKIASIVIFLNIFGIHWGDDVAPILRENIGRFLTAVLIASGYLFLIVMFIKGVYQVLTFNQYIDVYEGKNLAGFEISQNVGMHGTPISKSNSSNIDKVYAFRDSKMAGMTPEKAADLHIQTSKLGSNAVNKNVEGYINSKLGGMTPERGLDFLKGK